MELLTFPFLADLFVSHSHMQNRKLPTEVVVKTTHVNVYLGARETPPFDDGHQLNWPSSIRYVAAMNL